MKNIYLYHFFLLLVFFVSIVYSTEDFLSRVTRGAQQKKDRLLENEENLGADDVFLGKIIKHKLGQNTV